jgi:monoterpene epsilon-lactone hydrolase
VTEHHARSILGSLREHSPRIKHRTPQIIQADQLQPGNCRYLIHTRQTLLAGIAISIFASHAPGQQTPCDAKQANSSKIAPDGTAYVTRIMPVPATISPEAQKVLARVESDAAVPQTLEQRRALTDKWQAGVGETSQELYPVRIAADTIAGVPVRVITPLTITPEKRDRVLINLHGGGFNSDSGSLSETIPIANLTGTKVIAVLYRLAPNRALIS